MNTEESKARDNVKALLQSAKLGGMCQQATNYSEQGKHEAALNILDQVLKSDSKLVEAHNKRGLVLTYMGRLEEAASSFRRAIALKPDFADAYRLLTLIQRINLDDNILTTMKDLYEDTDTAKHSRIHLGFALGKVYNDSGNYNKAASYYMEANRLNRETLRYNEKEYIDTAEYFFNTFTSEYFTRNAGTGISDDTPIFIVGMPRSGSTLLEQILASHPEVEGAGEVPYISQLVVQQVVDDGQSCLAWLDDPSSEILIEKGNEYLRRVREHSGSSTRYITDKMLSNFWFIGFIRQIMPNARIIHVQRNALDNCLSIFTNYFSDNMQYASDLTELGRYYRIYTSLMSHWNKVMPGFIYDISYEDLIEDMESEVRRLLDYCKLPFNEQCLAFHESNRAVQTVSFAQVRKPLYKGSIGRWKSYEKMIVPLIAALEAR